MKEILNSLFAGAELTRVEARTVLLNIANQKYNPAQVAAFLTVYRMRSVSVDELAGFREAMLDLCNKIDLSEFKPVDLCGTGGDEKNTFNISTLSSFVVAACGNKVAKHGNYAVSSSCGSSNILELCGIKFTNDPDLLKKQIDRAGICFLHAPLFHPSMKNVAPIRKDLGVKTFFNLLGPLVNPSSPDSQVIGVYNLELVRLFSLLSQRIKKQITIVHSLDGYDEISLTSGFKVVSPQHELTLQPEDIGFQQVRAAEIEAADNLTDNAVLFMRILEGKGNSQQNAVVIANSALSLYAAASALGKKSDIKDHTERARYALESGEAMRVFKKLKDIS